MKSASAPASKQTPQDKVSRILIRILAVVTLGCWAAMLRATYLTYREAPPLPDRFVAASGQVVMTRDDIVAGKSGFRQADLMDSGSLYGMGSYFGEDYTAEYLVRLATEVQGNLAQARYGMAFAQLTPEQQSGITRAMQGELTLYWQWMRMPGDAIFAVGALLMAYDFSRKLRLARRRGAAHS